MARREITCDAISSFPKVFMPPYTREEKGICEFDPGPVDWTAPWPLRHQQLSFEADFVCTERSVISREIRKMPHGKVFKIKCC